MNPMKRTSSLVLGLTLSLASLGAFAAEPAAKPATEKSSTEKKAAPKASKTKAPKASPKKAAPAAGEKDGAAN
jgi:hypothetical protein